MYTRNKDPEDSYPTLGMDFLGPEYGSLELISVLRGIQSWKVLHPDIRSRQIY